MSRPKRPKGLAFDRSSQSWKVYQYSVDSPNPQRRDKAQAARDAAVKLEDDPGYFVRELVNIEEQKGLSTIEAKNTIADKLGVTRRTLNRAMNDPSIAMQERSYREWQRIEAGNKGYRGRQVKSLVSDIKQVEEAPVFDRDGFEVRQWSTHIPGSITRESMKQAFYDFANGAYAQGANMVVASVTFRTDLPGWPHSEPREIDISGEKVGYTDPDRDTGDVVRVSSGREGEGYDPLEFIYRIDDVVEMIAEQTDVEYIQLYARE